MLKDYIKLTKPGIIMGNLITATGGFLLASHGHFDLHLFLSLISGLALIIASGCVFNNYKDRAIDQKMTRTKNRPLVTGSIDLQKALFFGAALVLFGSIILSVNTNELTLSAALFGFVFYVNVYTPLKLKSSHATLVGSIAGAIPPVVGYVAALGKLDLAAFLLFLIVTLWQMPHFYAIALYRMEEYQAANIPVLPLVKGIQHTKVEMIVYTFLFVIAAILPTVFGYTGPYYLAAASCLGVGWLYLALRGLKTDSVTVWAKGMFRASLVIVLALNILLSIDYV